MERAEDISGELPDVVVDILMHQIHFDDMCVLIKVHIQTHTHTRWLTNALVDQAAAGPDS